MIISTILLVLLFLTITLSAGGGLYEILVIYPNWKYNVDPLTLKDKLQTSGQDKAGKRYWPLVSPAQGLLAMVNIALAWNYVGEAQCYWLSAAIVIFVTRVITFAYFIPVMITKIMRPEQLEKAKLQTIVNQWTALSPWRLLPEFVAWGLVVATLMKM